MLLEDYCKCNVVFFRLAQGAEHRHRTISTAQLQSLDKM
jgi:hypothetical protein